MNWAPYKEKHREHVINLVAACAKCQEDACVGFNLKKCRLVSKNKINWKKNTVPFD